MKRKRGRENGDGLKLLNVNGSNAVSYAYDNDGLMTGAGNLNLGRAPANGLLSSTTLGSISSSYTYNGFGEIETESYTKSGNQIYGVSYDVRDALGRIKTRTETIEGETTVYEYIYDSADRLYEVYETRNQVRSLMSRYEYDDNGNRLSHWSDYRGYADDATYDSEDRLTRYGSSIDGYTDYVYTDNGELSSKTLNGNTTNYTYDVFGNLKQVVLPDKTIDYVIDPLGRRVGKKVNGALQKRFLYQDGLKIAAELDSNNNVRSRFVYAEKANVPEYMVWYDEITYRIITNHLGSPVMVVNTATGQVALKIEYDEFGREIHVYQPVLPRALLPFGFAGGLYDPDTRLVHFGAREYDPQTGRWTSKDPILFAGGDTNLYGYVMNDPVNYLDSDGKIIGLICVGVTLITLEYFAIALIEAGQKSEDQRKEAEFRSRHGLPIDYLAPLSEMNGEDILAPIGILPELTPMSGIKVPKGTWSPGGPVKPIDPPREPKWLPKWLVDLFD